MNNLNKSISVIEPVNEALEKTKILLFKPFNLEKWFLIGFCAWLTNLFCEGFGGGINFRLNGQTGSQTSQVPAEALNFFRNHTVAAIIITAAIITLFLAVLILFLWLSSRGRFMFLDCLAKNKGQIRQPWKVFKQQANGLFGFRLLLIIVSLICMTALSIPMMAVLVLAKTTAVSIIAAGILFFAILLLIFTAALILGLVQCLTFDFVVPIMYLQRTGILAGWRQFGALFWGRFWKFILYVIFKVLIVLCIAAIMSIIVFFSCCCCCIGIILFIPYIGTVILLPFFSFLRLYSLCFFRQFGSEFDVFLSAA